jgi:hypothetical protein
MTTWTQDELVKINTEEMLELAAELPDGSIPKTVNIWVVRVGDTLYVRSYSGADGKWYVPATETRKGRVSAGGVTKNVEFIPIDDENTKRAVDEAYRGKYTGSAYAESMATEPVRSNTLEVVPVN